MRDRHQPVEGRPRIVVVTPVMAPYRMPLFNALEHSDSVELLVLFQERRCPLHEWDDVMAKAEFHYAVLPSVGSLGRGVRRSWLSYGLIGHVRLIKPHVVVLGGFNQPIAYQALLLRRLFGYQVWLWIESTLNDTRPASTARDRLKRWAVDRSDGVLVPGTAAEAYAAALGAKRNRIRTAPNSIDVMGIASMATQARQHRAAIRDELNLKGIVFTYVGRVVKEKGVHDLMDAFGFVSRTLGREGLTCSLLLIGSGPELQPLLARAHRDGLPNVVSAGFVQPAKLPTLLAASDMLVLPSWSDPWGMVINEAQACGLPVISTKVVGAAADLIDPTGAGLVVDPRDPTMLGDAMLLLAREPSLRASMGSEARTVANSYSPANTAQAFVDVAVSAAGECVR
jgi:glycosyltransferase involved in cell wall biosynthesis